MKTPNTHLAGFTPGPCPEMDPRLPDDFRHPEGMMESNRDFIGHNSEWLEWCEKNARLIAAAPELLEALKDLMQTALSRGEKLGLDDKGPVLDKARAAIGPNQNRKH